MPWSDLIHILSNQIILLVVLSAIFALLAIAGGIRISMVYIDIQKPWKRILLSVFALIFLAIVIFPQPNGSGIWQYNHKKDQDDEMINFINQLEPRIDGIICNRSHPDLHCGVRQGNSGNKYRINTMPWSRKTREFLEDKLKTERYTLAGFSNNTIHYIEQR